MKIYFAHLLSLLPSITQGQHVNLRGASVQDEPESIRQLDEINNTGKPVNGCWPEASVDGWFASATKYCRSNTYCTTPGDKCLVGEFNDVLICGNPVSNEKAIPLC